MNLTKQRVQLLIIIALITWIIAFITDHNKRFDFQSILNIVAYPLNNSVGKFIC